MKVIEADEFDRYWQDVSGQGEDRTVLDLVQGIIAAVRAEGDAAVRRFASRFEKSAPEVFEVSGATARAAWEGLRHEEPELAAALELAADHIRSFAELQKAQFKDFEYEMAPGLFTGQRVIPVKRAAVYVPGGRFPLISSVLMGVIPATAAGVEEVLAVSPPRENGLPDRRILAAAYIAGAGRFFALGGAQAIAGLALGTETIPRVDLIAGPGNKYVAAAKRLLYGEVGIDFVAGPTDVLIITDGSGKPAAAELAAADMLAQAEHDGDARARVLVSSRDLADRILRAVEQRLALLSTADTASASLDAGGLIVIYKTREEAARIANTIAPEHLELQTAGAEDWLPLLHNYGSLFIGAGAAEVLGDYSAGINHTLPTSGSARFTGGLSVRHFLKTVTTLRCTGGKGYEEALESAKVLAQAEGLWGHRESALLRRHPAPDRS
ncbi:MAG: histidinol dehydrogenase [Spirochaetaceae bacterium]|jgi:histidinol dehydrogenase|nr:histidinol dehydrogenase [Spirochaetaceae bacterium]